MECRNCPYAKEEFDRRIRRYQEYVDKNGIPNDIYGDWTLKDAMEFEEPYCWCEKTGGKIWWYGQCSDAYLDIPKYENRSKRKRRNKRERDLKHKNHLKYLHQHCNFYPSPVTYTDEIWVKGCRYVENPKPYYKRLYRGNHKSNRYSWYKKYANRCVRRYKGELHSGGSYKKVFDYWWSVD